MTGTLSVLIAAFAVLHSARAIELSEVRRCQKLFVEDARGTEKDFAPWTLLPDAAVTFDTLKLAVQIEIAPGAAVPFEGLGVDHDARVVPPPFIHVRDGRVFALLTGTKFEVLAIAEALQATYGADRLSFQIKAEPGPDRYAFLPMPDYTQLITAVPTPLTRDTLFTDVTSGRFAVALTEARVPARAARALNIAWLETNDEVLAALRRDEGFARSIPGGVVVSSVAYARLAKLAPRPLAPALDALVTMPDESGPWDLNLVRRQILSDVDANSAWAINAVFREWAHAHDEDSARPVNETIFRVWRALAPHESPRRAWAEIERANLHSLAIASVEGSGDVTTRRMRLLWAKLRASVRNYIPGRSRDFDATTHEIDANDAVDIVLTLRERYALPHGDPAALFAALWTDQLKSPSPENGLTVGAADRVLNRTNASEDQRVVAAYAHFLRSKSTSRPAEPPAPTVVTESPVVPDEVASPPIVAPAPEVDAVAATASAPAPSEDAGVPWPLPDDFDVDSVAIQKILKVLAARFNIGVGQSAAAHLYINALYAEIGLPVPSLKSSASAAKYAYYDNRVRPVADLRADLRDFLAARAAKRKAQPTAPLFETLDPSTISARDIIELMRDRFTVALVRPTAAQELFEHLYRAELGTGAPDFKFIPLAASKAYYSGSKKPSQDIKAAFERFLTTWRAKHRTPRARPGTDSTTTRALEPEVNTVNVVKPAADTSEAARPEAAESVAAEPAPKKRAAPQSQSTAQKPPRPTTVSAAPVGAPAPIHASSEAASPSVTAALIDPDTIVDAESTKALLQSLKDDQALGFKHPGEIIALFTRLFQRLPADLRPQNVPEFVAQFGLSRWELDRIKRGPKPAEHVAKIYRAYYDLALRAQRPRQSDVRRVNTIIGTLATRLSVTPAEVVQRGDVFATLMAWDGAGHTLAAEVTPAEFVAAQADPRSPGAIKLFDVFAEYERAAGQRYAARARKLMQLSNIKSHWTTSIARGLRSSYGDLDAVSAFRKLWANLLPPIGAAEVEVILARNGVEPADLEAALNYPVPPAVQRRLRATWSALLGHARQHVRIATREWQPPNPAEIRDVHHLLIQLSSVTQITDLNRDGAIIDVFRAILNELDPVHSDSYRFLLADSGLRADEHKRLRDDPADSEHRILRLYRTIYSRVTGDDTSVEAEAAPVMSLPSETTGLTREARLQMQITLERLHPNLALSARSGYGRAFDGILKRLALRPRYDQARAAFDEIKWQDDDYVLVSNEGKAALQRVRRAWRILQLVVEPRYVRDDLDVEAVKRTHRALVQALKVATAASTSSH